MPPATDLASLAGGGTVFASGACEKLERLRTELEPLARRYDVVVANPPYMGAKNMNSWLSAWVKDNYPDVKGDLFSCFMVRNSILGSSGAQLGFMTPYVWMFISTYEPLRKFVIEKNTITSLIQLEYSGFAGATVPICTFTLQHGKVEGYKGGYVRLSDFVGADQQAPKALEALANPKCGWFYRVDPDAFSALPGYVIAYWFNSRLFGLFKGHHISDAYIGKEGVGTRNDDVFLRNVWEVSQKNIGRGNRWIITDKAGGYRKWYPGLIHLMDWEDDGYRIKNYRDYNGKLKSRPQNTEYLFKPGVTWGKVGSGEPSFRLRNEGFGFNDAAPTLFGRDLLCLVAFLNTSLARELIRVQGETLNLTTGMIGAVPLPDVTKIATTAEDIARFNIVLSKMDWDAFEVSIDFGRHPLV